MIIAAFAGTGKSYFCEQYKDKALDLWCMPFKYSNFIEESATCSNKEALKADDRLILRPGWELLYYDTIKHLNEKYPSLYIVIPTVRLILKMLKAEGIHYTLVYPQESLKTEYEKRFKTRGNTDEFMDVFIGRWDLWIQQFRKDDWGKHIVLKRNQYLVDVIFIE